MRGDGAELEIVPEDEEVPRFAFIGVRSCDLAAISVQDRTFVHGAVVDPS